MNNEIEIYNKNQNLVVSAQDNDMMIPFIKIIQTSSDEMIPSRENYNPEVRPGDIYSSLTKTIFREPKVIVCGMKKYYAEWQGSSRGRLVAKHLENSDIVKSANKVPRQTSSGKIIYDLKTVSGNELTENFAALFLLKNADGFILPGRYAFSKSTYIDGKKLNTNLAIYQNSGIPVFSFTTNITSNSKGSWYIPVFSFDGYEKDQNIINTAINLSRIADTELMK